MVAVRTVGGGNTGEARRFITPCKAPCPLVVPEMSIDRAASKVAVEFLTELVVLLWTCDLAR